MMVACVASYVKPCKSAIANMSLSFYMNLFGLLLCTTYLWENDLSVKTSILAATLVATLITPHILVTLWAGYTFTKYIRGRFGYHRNHSLYCRRPMWNIVSGIRNSFCISHRNYQELSIILLVLFSCCFSFGDVTFLLVCSLLCVTVHAFPCHHQFFSLHHLIYHAWITLLETVDAFGPGALLVYLNRKPNNFFIADAMWEYLIKFLHTHTIQTKCYILLSESSIELVDSHTLEY